MVASLENLRINLSIDIATGDIITPREIKYFYPLMFEERKLPIYSYNVETIIAEKLQALVSLKGLNSRTKDFYDLYFLFKQNEKYFDIATTKEAIKATFKRREMNLEDILEVVDSLYNNRFLKERWEVYRSKYSFVEKVEFKEVLDMINEEVKKLGL